MAMWESDAEKAALDALAREPHEPDCKECVHKEICHLWTTKNNHKAYDYEIRCFAPQKDYIRKSQILHFMENNISRYEKGLELVPNVSDAILVWSLKATYKLFKRMFEDDEKAAW